MFICGANSKFVFKLKVNMWRLLVGLLWKFKMKKKHSFYRFSAYCLINQQINSSYCWLTDCIFGWSRRCDHFEPPHSSYIQKPPIFRLNLLLQTGQIKLGLTPGRAFWKVLEFWILHFGLNTFLITGNLITEVSLQWFWLNRRV